MELRADKAIKLLSKAITSNSFQKSILSAPVPPTLRREELVHWLEILLDYELDINEIDSGMILTALYEENGYDPRILNLDFKQLFDILITAPKVQLLLNILVSQLYDKKEGRSELPTTPRD